MIAISGGRKMKNELLLASILLGQPVAAMTQVDLQNSIQVSKQFNKQEIIGVFEFGKIIDGHRWIEDENGEIFKVPVKQRLYMEVKNEVVYQPSYYDEDLNDYVEVEMDQRINIIYKNIADENDTVFDDTEYYAKKVGENRYRLYDCDSSSSCYSSAYLEFSIYDSPKGKVIKIKKEWQGHKGLTLNMFKKNDFLLETKN